MGSPVKGAQGKKVEELQKLLNAAVKSVRLKVDGDFADKTEQAVKAFQKTIGVPVNGVVDAGLMTYLMMARKGVKWDLADFEQIQDDTRADIAECKSDLREGKLALQKKVRTVKDLIKTIQTRGETLISDYEDYIRKMEENQAILTELRSLKIDFDAARKSGNVREQFDLLQKAKKLSAKEDERLRSSEAFGTISAPMVEALETALESLEEAAALE